MAVFSSDTGREGRGAFARPANGACHRLRFAAALVVALAALGTVRPAPAGTLVSMNTNRGTILIDLFDDLVPETVDNFLSYVNSSAYTSTLVHRSTSLNDTGLAVIQGGGYTYNSSTGQFVSIPRPNTVALQYNRANSRGTIAMARTADPNSASTEWFINTSDNSATLGQSNGGGYAVFGWVVGGGMSVADGINNLFKTTVSGFPNVPLQNYTLPNPVQQANLVFNNSITVVGEHPDFQNPFLDVDVVNDGILRTSDAHAVINDLLSNGPRALVGPFSGTNYLDVNGNGSMTISDAHRVINALLSPSAAPLAAPQASGMPELDFLAVPMSAPALLIPEPSSFALGSAAALMLAAGAAWRRRRRAR
jgi:cyclophilin family peptidyl-prolyl cis-trans isomerase